MNRPSPAVPLLLVVAVPLACGRGPSLDTRTFELSYLDANLAAEMIDPYVYGDRAEGGKGMISIADNVITVRETADNLEKIARVLEQYDVPSPMAQLHFKIIEADGAARTDSAIADVESALRRLFKFRGYRLIAQAIMGGVEGSEVRQQTGAGDQEFAIRVHIQDIRGSVDSGTVRMEVELWPRAGSAMLATTVSVGTGQTVVLGSSQSRPRGGTLILAVEAELVNP